VHWSFLVAHEDRLGIPYKDSISNAARYIGTLVVGIVILHPLLFRWLNLIALYIRYILPVD